MPLPLSAAPQHLHKVHQGDLCHRYMAKCHVLVLTSTAFVWFQALLADISSKVCQGPDSPKGYSRFLRITIFSLNQARRLGSLLLPHRAFQGHAAHMARWPVMLSPNGSSDTCMSEMLAHIPPCRFTAHTAHWVPAYPKVFRHSYMPLSRRT